MRCGDCGGEAIVKKGQRYHYTESGLDNVYLNNIELRVCQSCGSTTPRIPKINELHSTIGIALALIPSPLSGKELRFLRQHLGFKAREWAALLRIDESTLSRWESGEQKIGAQSDSLIRLMYIRVIEEREGRMVLERVAERIAAIFDHPTEKDFVCINANNPTVYRYCSESEMVTV